MSVEGGGVGPYTFAILASVILIVVIIGNFALSAIDPWFKVPDSYKQPLAQASVLASAAVAILFAAAALLLYKQIRERE
jgi:multisubunit Na+/H+ antiporter MnhC subunit